MVYYQRRHKRETHELFKGLGKKSVASLFFLFVLVALPVGVLPQGGQSYVFAAAAQEQVGGQVRQRNIRGQKNGKYHCVRISIAKKGIPFVGKQPIGEFRWKAPVDAKLDDGVFSCSLPTLLCGSFTLFLSENIHRTISLARFERI